MQRDVTDEELARRVTRSTLANRTFLVVVGLAAGVGLILSLVTVLQVRHTQKQTSPLVTQVAEGNERIKDCTTPGGECYQRNQQATADVIQILLQGTKAQTRAAALASATAAAVCIKADPASTVPEIAACVKEQLRLVTD